MINWLIEQSIFSSVLIATIVAVHKLFGSKVGASGAYLLWSLVPLHLLLSLLLSPEHLPISLQVNTYVVGAGEALQQTQVSVYPVKDILFWFWLAGAAIFTTMVWGLHRYNLEKLDAKPWAQPAAAFGQGELQLKQSTQVHPPMVTGLRSVAIVLPKNFEQLDARARDLMIQHELTHYRRGDLYWNFLAVCLLCLFWFNPLAWWGYRQFRHSQELACDSEVLKNQDKSTKLIYAKAFLEQSFNSAKLNLMSLSYGGKHNLKDRLNNIRHGKSGAWRALPIALALLGSTVALQAIGSSKNLKAVNGVHPIMRISPVYPENAIKQGLQGSVTLGFSINTDGSVGDVTVIESDLDGLFDASAILALEHWVYSKPERQMRNQLVAIDFRLDGHVNPDSPQNIERINIAAN